MTIINDYDTQAMLSLEIGRYTNIPLAIYHRLTSFPKTFLFYGREYRYFFHAYNKTWMNERAIEIPLVSNLINQYDPQEILEVGNVTSHYVKTSHTIVDKYERRNNVLNQDIVALDKNQKYKFIFSISTIEHIGWDETPRESGKHRVALKKMIELLKPGGNLLITIPIGYNLDLDQDLFSGTLVGKVDYFLRTSNCIWQQVLKDEIINVKYGSPYKAANALAVLSYTCP
jgi:hypothetical protein